eukprot:COSAG01_NODE_2162_length_8259_cov_2.289371_7_plen_56_part_00
MRPLRSAGGARAWQDGGLEELRALLIQKMEAVEAQLKATQQRGRLRRDAAVGGGL